MSEPVPPRRADGVDVVAATPADLQLYADANRQLGQMQVPVMVSRDRPNERLFVAVLDGTGNDMNNPAMGERTGISRIFEQIRDQQNSGELTNVATGYLAGPGTGPHRFDGMRGHTFEERGESMYRQFIEQSARWLRENPDADIRVAALGFSRGAEQAAYFTRLVDERGIQDPTGAVYTTDDTGLVTGVQYTRPPLVAPGQVAQAAVLQDPVPTGDPANYDRRLPPSVVSAVQIRARDEPRDQFVDSRHLPDGLSDGGRSLHVTVPGAHSDIGDAYAANGLGLRNTNMTMQYVNGLVDNGRPLLQLRPETQAPDRNLIHDSEQHMPWVYTRRGFDRDGIRDERNDLAPQPWYQRNDPAMTRREPMDQELADRLPYRTLPMAPVPTEADPRRAAVEATPATTPQPPGGGESLFDRLARSAQAGDAEGTRGIGRQFLDTAPGQSWLQQGREFNLEQAAQREQTQREQTPLPPPVIEQPQRQTGMSR